MINNPTIIHLRFPFSLFLLPIYLFALSQSPEIDKEDALWVFLILHFLVYPASNGYNSYFDKDQGSIGGVKAPPEVSKKLYKASLIIDAVALILSLMVGWQFTMGILIYGLVSKAYSHPSIRLKKYPIIGWLVIGVFQGFLIFIISFMAINGYSFVESLSEGWVPALLCVILLLGSYPMTQIYQHDEDFPRGDITISYKLGVLGTFHFTATFFTLASISFFLYFQQESFLTSVLFLAFLLPTIIFFGIWYFKTRKNLSAANFANTMKLNWFSSIGLSTFFALKTLIPM